MDDLKKICNLLNLSDYQTNIVEMLSEQKSLSKSKKNLLRIFFHIQPNADFVDAEINQLVAFGLVKLFGSSPNIRISLIRSFWEIEFTDIQAIAKLALGTMQAPSILNFDQLVNKIKHNLNKYKLTSVFVELKNVKVVATCIFISSKNWGIVDNKVVRVKQVKN